MGYWKDNFPGSEAYFQRIRIAKGVVAYSVVVGGLLLAFSPLAKAVRQSLNEHEQAVFKDPVWLTEKMARKLGGNIFTGVPTKESMDVFFLAKDRDDHSDLTRPKELQKEMADFSLGKTEIENESSNNMSKLSRYKKPPAVKLPLPPKNKNSVKKKSVLDSNSDDDDDFIVPKPSRSNVPSITSRSEKQEDNSSQIRISSSKQIKGGESRPQEDGDECLESASPTIVDVRNKNKQKPDIASSDDENSPLEIEKTKQPSAPQSLSSAVPEIKSKPEAVCPFCWKKLNDKLTGTTHIKACAKNLPTNQIFEALQLQEKQIKEWEELGIAYPGYQEGGGGSTRNTGNSRRAGNTKYKPPRTRTKKNQDPELELAIALSESLHEEVERRKETENDFIISNDLQREIELRPLSKVKVPTETKPLQPPRPTKTVKRGKKVNLAELPLHKATEQDKKLDIERRLDRILDEHEGKGEVERYYIRENPPIASLRLSHRLMDCLDTTSACLWSMSSSEISTKEVPEIYVTQSVSECKANQDLAKKSSTNPTIPTSIEGDHHNIDVTKVNQKTRINKSLPNKNETEKVTMKAAAQHPHRIDDSSSTQPQLIKDLLKMFVSMEAADVTVYGREEKPIKCHKFILLARSRKLYSEIVQETNRKGITRNVIALTSFSHLAVKAFVKFLYCGKLKELKGQDLEDALELGSIYGLAISQQQSANVSPIISHKPPNSSASSITLDKSCEQIVEHPSTSLNHISELNEREDIPIKGSSNPDKTLSRHDSLEDMFADVDYTTENYESKDIFDKNESNLVNKCSTNVVNFNHDEGSRDMFEDSDEENNPMSKEEIGLKSDSGSQFEDDNCKISLEDELMTQVDSYCRRLFSPKPVSNSPRCQNPDFMFPTSQSSLTASQVAEYIDYMASPTLTQQGQHSGKSKANKKHKLEDEMCSIPAFVDCKNDSIVIIEGDEDEVVSRSFKKLRKDPEFNVHCSTLSTSFLPTIFYRKPYVNLSPGPYDPCLSPIQRMEVDNDGASCHEDPFEDPFGTDGDSCFLNLPSVILRNSPLVSSNHVAFTNSPSANPYVSRRSSFFSSSPVSSRNHSQQDKELSATQTMKTQQKVTSKVGNGSKSKKQGKRASSQEPTPTRNVGQKNPYQAMDYSTIDTPILKKELKRYGLKPLPRSKAKLILRHIDEEISKK